MIISILLIAFILRISTLFYSIKNEKRLKKEGAVEYGQKNSMVMALLHIAFYFGAVIYSYLNKIQIDAVSLAGVFVWIFSFAVLLIVIYQIRDVWTVKLIIAKKHKINKSFIFKYIRHPNYFFNIIPELAGITLISKSYILFLILFPLYMVTLILRILEEEKVMKQNFAEF